MADIIDLTAKSQFTYKGLTFKPDTNRDIIGQLIYRLNKLKHANPNASRFKGKDEIIESLFMAMKDADYFFFTKNGNNYPNTVIGESYLCNVPQKRMGHLKPYRGELVRIVCFGSGDNWRRDLAVGRILT